jgi:hypothetical protein
VDVILQDLVDYCKMARAAKVAADADPQQTFISKDHGSHHSEVKGRLHFLQFYASESDYQFMKTQLRVIYDSLSKESPVASDQAEFLTWCKQACQATTQTSKVLDLNEVGEYLSELLQSKQLNLDTLKPAGFEFL